MSEKELKMIYEIEDAILIAAERFKKGEDIDVSALNALYDGIRILHHIKKIQHDYLRSHS